MTDRRASLFTYLSQLLSTAVVLFVLYIEYARLSLIDLDMIGMMVQGVIAAVVISFTLAVCSLLGLPLRLVPRIVQWWRKRQYIVVIGVITSLLVFWLSFTSPMRENAEIESAGTLVQTQLPNRNLVAIGWFLLTFCLLHFYPCSLIGKDCSRKQIQF